MKLSQLLKVMDKDDEVIIYDYRRNIMQSIANKPLYKGVIRKIYKDNPLNKGSIKYLLPCDNRLVVEISLVERRAK